MVGVVYIEEGHNKGMDGLDYEERNRRPGASIYNSINLHAEKELIAERRESDYQS